LVSGDTNFEDDIFVRDRWTGTTMRVSVTSGGSQANDSSDGAAISDDGTYVAFSSDATNGFPDVLVHDRLRGSTERVSVAPSGGQIAALLGDARISGNGRFLSFTAPYARVFLRDRDLGATDAVSDGSTSPGGRALSSAASPKHHTMIRASITAYSTAVGPPLTFDRIFTNFSFGIWDSYEMHTTMIRLNITAYSTAVPAFTFVFVFIFSSFSPFLTESTFALAERRFWVGCGCNNMRGRKIRLSCP